ncbi:MAG: hypothetical protein P8P30_05500 [Rickettsiales bacterium]|nr:hypothetical protein [Rickettsiales bacterium]
MELNLDLLFDMIGMIGVVLLLLAYYLLQMRKIRVRHLSYSILNLFSAIFLLISLLWSWNTASVILEIIWIGISFYGIYRAVKERKNAKK